jgi:hypothetical protein
MEQATYYTLGDPGKLEFHGFKYLDTVVVSTESQQKSSGLQNVKTVPLSDMDSHQTCCLTDFTDFTELITLEFATISPTRNQQPCCHVHHVQEIA